MKLEKHSPYNTLSARKLQTLKLFSSLLKIFSAAGLVCLHSASTRPSLTRSFPPMILLGRHQPNAIIFRLTSVADLSFINHLGSEKLDMSICSERRLCRQRPIFRILLQNFPESEAQDDVFANGVQNGGCRLRST
ncbi:unnamed protein product [Cuscuta europaea]|uniref:Uncharacterized protein n=1 Tax=Cuscuta europaea TaxID=41803 RepID=A0A9P1EP56_CUSEU|nr:unnamed protein product [Cuscuta europaea]